jgi:hypothetical protein
MSGRIVWLTLLRSVVSLLVVNRFPAPGGPDSVRNSQLLVGCSLSLVELVQSTPTQLMVG